jgi:nicotinamidase/pyrazinamidase
MSFFENNKNKTGAQLFSVLNLPDVGPQVMWPVHCVQNSKGAEFHPQLKMENTDVIVQKGTNTNVDSYSAFHDNNATSQTEMNAILKRHGITHIFFTGVATDFCVGYSVLDAKNEGFDCTLV